MEAMVHLFRILANFRRLQVLRVLTVLGEMRVRDIARACALSQPRLSAHLRHLTAAGLLWRRRSGPRVFYRIAEAPSNPLTAALLDALRACFARVKARDSRQVAQAAQSRSKTDSDAALFACFTAFTHPRRLQIIRLIERRGACSPGDIVSLLHMSPRACMLHLDKLRRRDVLRRRRDGRRARYVLHEGKGMFQRTVLDRVRQQLSAGSD